MNFHIFITVLADALASLGESTYAGPVMFKSMAKCKTTCCSLALSRRNLVGSRIHTEPSFEGLKWSNVNKRDHISVTMLSLYCPDNISLFNIYGLVTHLIHFNVSYRHTKSLQIYFPVDILKVVFSKALSFSVLYSAIYAFSVLYIYIYIYILWEWLSATFISN